MNPYELAQRPNDGAAIDGSPPLLSIAQLDALIATTVEDDDLVLKARYNRILHESTTSEHPSPEDVPKTEHVPTSMSTNNTTRVSPDAASMIPLPPSTTFLLQTTQVSCG
jgi:hypothetical protein